MRGFSLRVLELLHIGGWYEGRKIDTHNFVEFFEKASFPYLPFAIEFLSEFGDLYIPRPLKSGIHVRLNTNMYDELVLDSEYIGDLEVICKALDRALTLIGKCEDIFDELLMDASGAIYILSESGSVYLLGESTEKALEVYLSIDPLNGQKLKPIFTWGE